MLEEQAAGFCRSPHLGKVSAVPGFKVHRVDLKPFQPQRGHALDESEEGQAPARLEIWVRPESEMVAVAVEAELEIQGGMTAFMISPRPTAATASA